MEFRDLKEQYKRNKEAIDNAIAGVINTTQFIGGMPVEELERRLADYVGVKHCVTCANGTDALQLALMAWNVHEGDAVFVPDFTFFSTAEVVPWMGATPVFVDVERDTFNISPEALEQAIDNVLKEGGLVPKVTVAVNLFGQPADYDALQEITKHHNMLLLEDNAQGFGGMIRKRRAGSFGDIATTSFFPAKPLGCYGDGGAIFTDNDEWAGLLRSYAVHGKGAMKYDNVRIGMNSRLDTLQAAILDAKLDAFIDSELDAVNEAAALYSEQLAQAVSVPVVKEGFYSSWAQYTIKLKNQRERDIVQQFLRKQGIPSMVYYPKPLHKQDAFSGHEQYDESLDNTRELCSTVLSLPIHPYMRQEDVKKVCDKVKEALCI